MSRVSALTFENTIQTITNLSNNEKVPNIGSMIKEHEVTGVWLLRGGKHQVTTSARKEDDTDSNKKGPLPCSGYLGDAEIRTDHEDNRKNQATTTVDKEDNADSTATVTTAVFTSICGSELGDDATEGLAEPTTLNDQICVFGKKKMGEAVPQVEKTYIPILQGGKTIQT